MPTFGKVDEYNETEEWRHYIERVNHFFEANEITDLAKKRSIFLVSVGAKTYKLIRSLVAPADPKDKSYEELAKLVQDHYMPKPSAIVQRFKFNTRSQQPGENIAMFLAELRHLTEHCEFGTTLDEMLRDRLVCGVRDIRIQRRLLAEPKLTLKRSLDLALAIEAAEKDVSEIQKGDSQEGNSSLNKVDVKVEQGAELKCYRCGGNHLPGNCYFKDAKCYACGKVGHLSRVCQGKKKGRKTTPASEKKSGNPQATHLLEGEEEAPTGDQGVGAYSLFTFCSKRTAPYKVQLNVAGQVMEMEVDTGASLSVISEKMYNNLSSEGRVPPLEKSEIVLRTYTGEEVKPKGSCTVNVSYQGADYTLPLLVVGGDGPALLGRNWLEQIKLYWPGIKQLASTCHDKQLEGILQKHAQLFQEGLGTLKGTAAKIHVDPTATPIFHKARPVPYALREKIEHDLERLEKAGTIEPVQYSEWATPIVPVMKSDDTVRVCGDYKLTVNKVSKLDGYPIPKLDDLYTKLAEGQTFTELDLSHAYEQMLVDEDSREFLTINTHKGLYRYNRLPYGVSSAPGIFQRTMEGLLQGIPSTGVLLDNILITGPSNEEHLANIEKVFERLSDAGLRLKAGKCQFMKPVLECLGHRVDAEGFHPVEAKVNAIKEAPAPTNPSELKSFLGMLNFYGKFLPNLSSTLEPLHLLLRKDVRWEWGTEQQEAFETAKNLLQSSDLLVHYDPEKELVVSCDASPYGVGAVLAHVMEDGSEKPVAYASRTLSSAERGYGHLDKEALAVVFAVKKFHQFLYGRHFKVFTDHKPLLGLLNPDRPTPLMASSRMQRWSLTLLAYEYELLYRPGSQNGNADGLSRLPLADVPEITPVPGDVIHLLETISTSPVDATKVKLWTARDPVLSLVLQFVLQGWPLKVEDEALKPYFTRREELSVHAGCLLWGTRVVIPPQGREEVLNTLHESHPGIVRMKNLARSYVWWPKMDTHLEGKVKSCVTCQSHQKTPACSPLHPWEWPGRPWARVHIDYAGPFMGKMFLLIIDAHSKWMDIHCVNSATSSATIEKMRTTFAAHGLPEIVVSDNGSNFVSSGFKAFLQKNGIRHITSAPYHPSSNGLVERAVQTFKRGMKKQGDGTVETKLARFLLSYRITPQSTTGESPAQLRWGRSLRSHLDLLRPDVAAKVHAAQSKQKEQHDQHVRMRPMGVGDTVNVRNYLKDPKWLPGTIIQETGPVSARVELEDGTVVRRHHDQLLTRPSVRMGPEVAVPGPLEQEIGVSEVTLPDQDSPEITFGGAHPASTQGAMSTEPSSTPVRRYPARDRRPPQRYY